MLVQGCILVEQAHHGTDQPQLTTLATSRGDSVQQSACPFPVSRQQPHRQRRHHTERPTNDRKLIALHATFEDRGVIGAPVYRHGATPNDQRDDQQMLMPFNGPKSIARRTRPCLGSWLSACNNTASARCRGSRRGLWSKRDRRLLAAS